MQPRTLHSRSGNFVTRLAKIPSDPTRFTRDFIAETALSRIPSRQVCKRRDIGHRQDSVCEHPARSRFEYSRHPLYTLIRINDTEYLCS